MTSDKHVETISTEPSVGFKVSCVNLGLDLAEMRFDLQATVEDIKQRIQSNLGRYVTFEALYLIDSASGCKHPFRDGDWLGFFFPRDGWTIEVMTVETEETNGSVDVKRGHAVNVKRGHGGQTTEEPDLLTNPSRDAERLATFELGMKVAALQAEGFAELQAMLKQEQAARLALEAKMATTHQMMEARMIDVVGSLGLKKLSQQVNGMHSELTKLKGDVRKMETALVEDRGNISTLARTLREEALGIKFDCVRMINMESDTREMLREQVNNIQDRMFALENSVSAVRKEMTLHKADTFKQTEDCVNSCKTDNAASRIQANRVLENAIEDMRARGNDLVERAVNLETTSERIGTGLKQASDDFSRFVEGDFAAHLTDYKSQVVSKHGSELSAVGEKAAETAEAVDRHHTYIRETLRAELDQLQTARQQVDTAVANEQNTLSTLICRMQVAETQLSQMETRHGMEREEFGDLGVLMKRADAQVRDFAALKTRVEGMGTQVNRQGILIQNTQEKQSSHASTLQTLSSRITTFLP